MNKRWDYAPYEDYHYEHPMSPIKQILFTLHFLALISWFSFVIWCITHAS